MELKKMVEFKRDNEKYNIFSYDEYKKSSIDLKLLKIKLLNEYYKIKFADLGVKKTSVYVDFDGVILDTIGCSSKLLMKLHGIDYYKHSRDNVEQDKIVGNFFATIDWNYLLDNSDVLNCGNQFLNLFKDSTIYDPTIYSAVSSSKEAEIKRNRFLIDYPNIGRILIPSKYPKECKDKNSILIDDSNFYLINWEGKPVHFDSGTKSIFFSISDLGEIYYLFPFNECSGKVDCIPGLYDNYYQSYDCKKKRLVWNKK